MSEIIFCIVQAVVVFTVTAIARHTIILLKQKIDSQTLENVMKWVKTAVLATEQTISAPERGQEKKAIVTDFLKGILIEKNISLSDEQLSELIEAEVKTMNESEAK